MDPSTINGTYHVQWTTARSAKRIDSESEGSALANVLVPARNHETRLKPRTLAVKAPEG